ncbi:hypothetical protein HZB07_03545 [Candidatus Saganbacteria bacterium]|nr:hypothetical protein [Candidatus Saganbacteria bacterium]
MSDLNDGISSVSALTEQINTLRKQQADGLTAKTNNQAQALDPQATLVELQKNFNDMLNNLVSSSDENNKKSNSDPFASFIDSQNTLNQLKNPAAAGNNNDTTTLP